MNAHASKPQCFEFSFPRLDTTVEVESSATGVVIRASRDTFTEERKACFIRELAAEGFINEDYVWWTPGRTDGLRWIVDASSFMPSAACIAQTRRIVLTMLLSAAGLWLFLMGALFIAARP